MLKRYRHSLINQSRVQHPTQLYQITKKLKIMNILIAKHNYQFLQNAYPSFNYQKVDETKNTITIKVSKITFNRLIKLVKEMGINPYAIINW